MVAIVINSSLLFGMDKIKMPRAAVLQKRLHSFGFDSLAPHDLANTSEDESPEVMLAPRELVVAIQSLISASSDQKGNLPGILAKVPAGKIHSMLVEALVGDDARVLEELQKQELYTPSNVHLVKMPNADVLRQRLEATHFTLFIKNSALVDNLADSDLTPLGVAAELDGSIKRFAEFLGKSGRPKPLISSLEKAVRASRQRFLEILLQDAPQALQELKELKLQ